MALVLWKSGDSSSSQENSPPVSFDFLICPNKNLIMMTLGRYMSLPERFPENQVIFVQVFDLKSVSDEAFSRQRRSELFDASVSGVIAKRDSVTSTIN